MSKSSTYHYLAALREKNFIVKNDDQYEIGLQFLLSGEYVRNRNTLYRYGKEEVDELAEMTGEYANLFTEQHGKGINLYKVCGSDAVGSGYQREKLHQPDQLHCTATGKAILAFFPEDRVDEVLEQHGLPERTANTITDLETLHDELATIRERGYAYKDEEEVEGLRAVGAPVIDHEETVLGSLSIAGPTSRLKGTPFNEDLPEQVQRAANVIKMNINIATHGTGSKP
jgi:DNA-binding IclR family transcriptional regulator